MAEAPKTIAPPMAEAAAPSLDRSTVPLVEMRDIRVSFGGVHAVDHVTVDLFAGEVVGLVGGNGAGKSTLMKALSGAHPQDGGEIYVNGELAHIGNPREAKTYGIETIYQTLALADNVDAAANIFLGRELVTRFGSLNDAAMESATREVMGRLNPRFKNLKSPVKSLSGGQRQSVAIARAVHFNAKILIMDEPTAALGPGGDGAGPRPRRPAEERGHRHLPHQPRHPRRLRPVGPHQRHAPGQARGNRQQGRRHQGRRAGHDHPGQDAGEPGRTGARRAALSRANRVEHLAPTWRWHCGGGASGLRDRCPPRGRYGRDRRGLEDRRPRPGAARGPACRRRAR